MSLLFIDSFDDRSSNLSGKYDASSGTPTAGGGGRTGNALSKPNAASFYLEKNVPTGATFIVGFAIKVATLAVVTTLIEFMDGATTQIFVRQNADNSLSVVNGSGTVLGSSTTAQHLTTASFTYLEFKATINNTTGSYELRADGATWISGSGANTRNSANNQATSVRMRWSDTTANVCNYDDYYICNSAGSVNNDFLGAIKIECKFPSGAGTTTQLTPTGAASNWDCVNDTTPNDDTDYVASATVGQEDTYALQDMTATVGTVVGVQYGLRARKDDAAVRQIAPVRRHAGTDYVGSTVTLTNSYANYYQLDETNPGTSAPYTISDINNLEAGVRIIA